MTKAIFFSLHVAMSADFIAAGDHFWLIAFKFAATPVPCGQDIDVPEFMKKLVFLVSVGSIEGNSIGDQAVRISAPGATRSG